MDHLLQEIPPLALSPASFLLLPLHLPSSTSPLSLMMEVDHCSLTVALVSLQVKAYLIYVCTLAQKSS